MRCRIRFSVDLDQIGLLDAGTGAHDLMRQITVIGQQQQPFGMIVQAADRIEPVPYRREG